MAPTFLFRNTIFIFLSRIQMATTEDHDARMLRSCANRHGDMAALQATMDRFDELAKHLADLKQRGLAHKGRIEEAEQALRGVRSAACYGIINVFDINDPEHAAARAWFYANLVASTQ
jgi:hypothetical protein